LNHISIILCIPEKIETIYGHKILNSGTLNRILKGLQFMKAKSTTLYLQNEVCMAHEKNWTTHPHYNTGYYCIYYKNHTNIVLY
jgi:hypothetical protein